MNFSSMRNPRACDWRLHPQADGSGKRELGMARAAVPERRPTSPSRRFVIREDSTTRPKTALATENPSSEHLRCDQKDSALRVCCKRVQTPTRPFLKAKVAQSVHGASNQGNRKGRATASTDRETREGVIRVSLRRDRAAVRAKREAHVSLAIPVTLEVRLLPLAPNVCMRPYQMGCSLPPTTENRLQKRSLAGGQQPHQINSEALPAKRELIIPNRLRTSDALDIADGADNFATVSNHNRIDNE